MPRFMVAETIYYSIEADSGASAIKSRKLGLGTSLPEKTYWRANCTNPADVLNGAQQNVATIRDKSVGPSDGRLWTYKISDELGSVQASDYRGLLREVRQRCESNSFETPAEEQIQQQLCDNLPVKCTEDGKLYANQYASRTNWPLVLRGFKLLAQDGDRGLGDIIARTVPKGEEFKKWYLKYFGVSCGCSERQTWLNANFPLT